MDQEALITESETMRHRRIRNQEKWPEFENFLLDRRRRRFLGEDENDWRLSALFYVAFYTGVLFFFACCLGIFTLILDEITPHWMGDNSPMQNYPGLAYRPVPDFQSNLIRFIQGKPETYKPFTDHVQTFLLQYENEWQVGENFIDCEKGRLPDVDEGKVCRFDVDTLGGQCTWQKDYGYDEGKPCVLIKMNKVIGWRPEPYQSLSEIPDAAAREWIEVNGRFDPDYMPITCQGRFDADFENIGNVTIYPQEGLPIYYYPYLNQEGYRAPLLMLKFNKPINGVVINVMCKIWAKNIKHIANDQLGLVQFSILVD